MTWGVPRVYAFGAPGDTLMKIGFSSTPHERARALRAQTGNVAARILYAVQCPSVDCARAVERRAHSLLASSRIEGEWFIVDLEAAMLAIDESLAAVAPREDIRSHPAINKRQSEAAKQSWVRRREKYGARGMSIGGGQ